MLPIFARPRPLNRFVLGCHMIVTRSYVRKLEFCNLIGAFTFQYAAILLDQEILRKSPDPFPGGRGLGTRLPSIASPGLETVHVRSIYIYYLWLDSRGLTLHRAARTITKNRSNDSEYPRICRARNSLSLGDPH